MSAEALTYDSLLSDLETYCERDDDPFLAQRGRFIMLAENRLAAEVRGLSFQRYVTGMLNSNTLAKPERWRETISINFTDGTERVFVQPRTYDFCRTFSTSATSDVPRYYAD